MKILITLTLITNVCFAQTILPIAKNSPAPFNGYIIDSAQEEKFRHTNEKYKLEKAKNVTLNDLKVVNEARVEFYRKTAEKYQNEAQNERFKGNLRSFGYFLLGVLATSVGIIAANKASKL